MATISGKNFKASLQTENRCSQLWTTLRKDSSQPTCYVLTGENSLLGNPPTNLTLDVESQGWLLCIMVK
jgi:hypothetical protein